MKVTFNIECTPEEARAFMGLPDVKPMQDALLQDMEAQLRANLQLMNPEKMFGAMLPTGMQNIENMQKMFWQQFQRLFAGMAGSPAKLLTERQDND